MEQEQEQAVIVHLPLSDNYFDSPTDRDVLFTLQDQIAATIEEAVAGEFDGDLVGEGECILYMYGPDADHLFDAIEPFLKSSTIALGGYAIKRYGDVSDPDASEVRVTW